nr:DUF6457 domain-containing protein [Actinoplanes derwentensis]
MAESQEWLTDAAGALGVPPLSAEQIEVLLDVVRVVAHGVARPAGPLAAYLAGVAVGRGANPATVPAVLAALVTGDEL